MTTTMAAATPNITQRFSSTSSASAFAEQEPEQQNEYSVTFHPVYVHRVSKAVLSHLQEAHSGWLAENGLDRGLRLNKNGTFVLNFQSRRKGFDAGRIWTSYDASTKQHWLSVYRRKVVGKFLLRDTSATNSATPDAAGTHFTSARSFAQIEHANQQAIRNVVDQMVATLSDNENPQKKRAV